MEKNYKVKSCCKTFSNPECGAGLTGPPPVPEMTDWASDDMTESLGHPHSKKRKYASSKPDKLQGLETYIECTKEWSKKLEYLIELYEEKIRLIREECDKDIEDGLSYAWNLISESKKEVQEKEKELEEEYNHHLEEAYKEIKNEYDTMQNENKKLAKEIEDLKAQLENPNYVMKPSFINSD